MELSVETVGDLVVVALRGEHLDASNAEEFKRDVALLLAGQTRVIFDMSELQFMDSAGLGAILGCLRRLSAAGGDLKLFGLSRPVRAVFDIARMHRVFEICATKEEAIQAFGG